MTTTKTKTFDLCFYGNRDVGFGFLLAEGSTIIAGNGEPKAERTLTDCLFLADEYLRSVGVRRGIVRVFAPGGERMSVVDLRNGMPYFGSLKWETAPVYMLTIA